MDDDAWSGIFGYRVTEKKCCTILDACSGWSNWSISKILSLFYWWRLHLMFEAKFSCLCQLLDVLKWIKIMDWLWVGLVEWPSNWTTATPTHAIVRRAKLCQCKRWDCTINRPSINLWDRTIWPSLFSYKSFRLLLGFCSLSVFDALGSLFSTFRMSRYNFNGIQLLYRLVSLVSSIKSIQCSISLFVYVCSQEKELVLN